MTRLSLLSIVRHQDKSHLSLLPVAPGLPGSPLLLGTLAALLLPCSCILHLHGTVTQDVSLLRMTASMLAALLLPSCSILHWHITVM